MRPISRRFPVIGLALAAGLALIGAAGSAQAQISMLDTKNALVQFLLRQIGTPGAFEVTAGRVTEPEEGVTALNDVRVADGDGVWLTIRQASFSWNPSALLSGRIEIERLRIEGMEMRRLSGDPEIEGGALAEAPPREPLAWPRSPIPLRVTAVELRDVRLSDRVLPQAIAFDGDGAVVDEGDAQTLRLDIRRTDAVEGRITLSYERRFDDDTLSLLLDAAEAAGGLVGAAADLPEDSASRFSLRAEGPPSDWRARLSASSDRVFSLTGAATVDYEGPIAADLDVTLEAGETLDPAVRRALSPNARLVGRIVEEEGGVIRVREAFLKAADLDLTVDGRYGRNDGALDFVLEGEARRGLSELIGGAAFERVGLTGRLKGAIEAFDLDGAVRLTGFDAGSIAIGEAALDLSVSRAGERFHLRADGEAADMRLGALGPETLGAPRLAFSAALDQGRLAIEEARLDSDALAARLSGDADLRARRLRLDYEARTADLGPTLAAFGVDGAGAARAVGEVEGPFDTLETRGAARVDRLRIGPVRLGDVTLDHRLLVAEAILGDVRLRIANGDFGAGGAGLRLRSDAAGLAFTGLEARLSGASLSGEARIAASTGLTTARIALAAPDLRPLGQALDLPLSGALQGSIIAETPRGAQRYALDLAADRLSVDGARFASGPARLAIEDAHGAGALDAKIDWALSRFDGARIGVAVLTANGPLDRIALGADLTLREALQPLTATLRGAYLRRGSTALLRLDEAEAVFGEGERRDRFALSAPLVVETRDGVSSIDRVALETPRGGALEARLDHAGPDGVALEAALDGFDLGFLGRRFGAPIEAGALSAEARLDTRALRPGGRLDLRISGVDAGGGARARPLDATLVGVWAGGRADLRLTAGAAGADELTATVRTTLRRLAGGGVGAPPGARLEGAVRWRGEVAEIWPLIPAPDHLLSGAAEVDLVLGGALDAPRVEGRIALSNGRYENIAFGAILEELTVSSRIEDGVRVALDVTAEAGDGRLTTTAMLDLAAADGPTVALDTALDRALLARRDDFTATFSGGVIVAGPVAAPAVSGRIEIDEAELRLIAPPAAAIPDLGPVRQRGSAAPPPAPLNETESVGATLDLDIVAERRFHMRGRGLDAEWSVDLKVLGSSARPLVTGRIERLRGRLDLLGRRFEMTRGDVIFDGGAATDPRLDIVFTRTASDIEGRVAIKGSASAPQLSFASTPELPEQDVLPRLLFGRPRTSLSAAEAAQLASGVATLLSGEAGLLDRARDLTGLDVLDYGEVSGGGEAVTAGRFVREGVLVGARQPLDGRAGAAFVEVDVLDDFSVDAEIDQEDGASIGATWRYDF